MKLRLVLIALLAACVMAPQVTFAQNVAEAESTPPEKPGVTNVAPVPGESSAKPLVPTTNYFAPSRPGRVSGILADSAPSSEPQGSGQTNKPAPSGYVYPSGGKLARFWLWNTFGPKAFVGAAVGATWGTWVIYEPPEWHKDATGWGKRMGSSLADNAMNTTALVLISAATRQDPIYYRCPCSGFWPRIGHVIKMTFMSRNRNGDAVLSPAKIISPFVGPMVTRNTIYPDRYNSGDAAASGAWNFLINAGWNLGREFILKSPQW